MSRQPATDHQLAVVGYTAGVFDLFHIGHLNILRHAREQCDFLIVGVTTDELAQQTKAEPPVIPLLERLTVLEHVRYVDHVVPQTSMDKLAAWRSLKFDVIFVGDNVRGTDYWGDQEQRLATAGVRVNYLPASYDASGDLVSRSPDDFR